MSPGWVVFCGLMVMALVFFLGFAGCPRRREAVTPRPAHLTPEEIKVVEREYDYEEERRQRSAAIAVADEKYFADKPALLQSYIDALAKDIAGWSFGCRRHGDFLSIEVTRGREKFATAINLGTSSDIRLIKGSAPSMDGVAAYSFHHQSLDGKFGYSSVPIGYASAGYELVAHVTDSPHRYRNSTFVIDNNEERYGMGSYSNVEFGGKADKPRRAEDDSIRFNRAGCTLYVPFGVGDEVYSQILKALE